MPLEPATVSIRQPKRSNRALREYRRDRVGEEEFVQRQIQFLLTLAILLPSTDSAPFIRWAFVDSVWFSGSQTCKEAAGACWSVVTNNLRFILYGFYPYEQQWRPVLAISLLLGFMIYSRNRRRWNKYLFIAWPIGLALMGVVMYGGVLGLPEVDTEKWSGISLTLLLSIFGLSAAYPMGSFWPSADAPVLPPSRTCACSTSN